MVKKLEEGTRLKAAARTAGEFVKPALAAGAAIGGAGLLGGSAGATVMATGVAGGLALGGIRKDIKAAYNRNKKDIEFDKEWKSKMRKEDVDETVPPNPREAYDKIIAATIEGKPIDIKQAFEDAMLDKVAERLDTMSYDIAQSTFDGPKTPRVEEPEEEPELEEEDPDWDDSDVDLEDDPEWAEDEDDEGERADTEDDE